MEAKVKVLGHAIHPALTALPIGLLVLVPFLDVAQMALNSDFWARMCFWLTAFGLAGALIAAVIGFVDWWFAVPAGTRARRIGLLHMVANLVAVGFFAIAFIFRLQRHIVNPLFAPFGLDLSGLMVLALGGWLGGELVQQHGVGINEGAHVNAPSSLDAGRLVRAPEQEQELPPTEPQPV
jgi:uncharacterized membrane protein